MWLLKTLLLSNANLRQTVMTEEKSSYLSHYVTIWEVCFYTQPQNFKVITAFHVWYGRKDICLPPSGFSVLTFTSSFSPLCSFPCPLLFFLVPDYQAQLFLLHFFFRGKQWIEHVLIPLIFIQVRGGGESSSFSNQVITTRWVLKRHNPRDQLRDLGIKMKKIYTSAI